MTNEELKRDFESAHIKHVHFKSKLRSFLFGNGGTEGPLRNPDECGLGLWSAARMRGQGPYARLPEAQILDRKHPLIHAQANRLMDLHRASRLSEATAGFGSVQVISDGIVALLQTMEAKLRTEG